MILRARYEAGVGNELEKKMREDEERLGIPAWGNEHGIMGWLEKGKTIGKPWEKHRKTMGKPWENGGLMGFHGIYPLEMTNIANWKDPPCY